MYESQGGTRLTATMSAARWASSTRVSELCYIKLFRVRNEQHMDLCWSTCLYIYLVSQLGSCVLHWVLTSTKACLQSTNLFIGRQGNRAQVLSSHQSSQHTLDHPCSAKKITRFKTTLRPAKIQYCYLLKDFNRKALMSRVSKSFKIYLTIYFTTSYGFRGYWEKGSTPL